MRVGVLEIETGPVKSNNRQRRCGVRKQRSDAETTHVSWKCCNMPGERETILRRLRGHFHFFSAFRTTSLHFSKV